MLILFDDTYTGGESLTVQVAKCEPDFMARCIGNRC